MKIRYGKYEEQFSLGIAYITINKRCLVFDLGFWYIEFDFGMKKQNKRENVIYYALEQHKDLLETLAKVEEMEKFKILANNLLLSPVSKEGVYVLPLGYQFVNYDKNSFDIEDKEIDNLYYLYIKYGKVGVVAYIAYRDNLTPIYIDKEKYKEITSFIEKELDI